MESFVPTDPTDFTDDCFKFNLRNLRYLQNLREKKFFAKT